MFTPIIEVLVRHHFSSEKHIFKIFWFLWFKNIEIGHIDKHKRNPKNKSNMMFIKVINQFCWEHKVRLWNDIQCSTCSHHQINIQSRVIKIERCLITNLSISCKMESIYRPINIINHTTMWNHYPFRNTRRTRCKNWIYRICIYLSAPCWFHYR